MKRAITPAVLIGAALVTVSGCGILHAETTPTPVNIHDKASAGGDFLPTYVQQLQAKQLPQDHCADPQTLADLLWPCDTPRDHVEHELGHTADKEH
jgi:hypothetical protein